MCALTGVIASDDSSDEEELFASAYGQNPLDLNFRPPLCPSLGSLIISCYNAMDDLLEPCSSTSIPHPDPERAEDAEMSSGDEDEGLDWTKLLP